jgi:nitrogen fixation-related uncharacterized protein
VVIGLLLVFVVVAPLLWGVDTRDGRDWQARSDDWRRR